MKRENISDALDKLDEDMIQHTMAVRKDSKGNNKNWQKWMMAAACLCALCMTVVAIPFLFPHEADEFGIGEPGKDGQETDETALQNEMLARKQMSDETEETFISIASLFASAESSTDTIQDAIQEMAMQVCLVPIGQYIGIYEKAAPVDSAVLEGSIGAPVPDTTDCYYVSGHTDLQYLIQKHEEEYSLWKFLYFNSEEYPYKDVLELVYDVKTADDITEIIVMPARMDNTTEGQRIQEMIGTSSVTGRSEIEEVYQILASMTCYGSGHWEMIDYGAADAPADTDDIPHKAVWLGRYLSVVTDYGNEIDELKYTAVSDMFYEFSGVAYNRLTEEQAESICTIFGIDG